MFCFVFFFVVGSNRLGIFDSPALANPHPGIAKYPSINNGLIPNWEVDMGHTETETYYETKFNDNLGISRSLQILPSRTVMFDEERLLRSKNIGEMENLQNIRRSAREYELMLEEIDNIYADVVNDIFGLGEMDSDYESDLDGLINNNNNNNNYNDNNKIPVYISILVWF